MKRWNHMMVAVCIAAAAVACAGDRDADTAGADRPVGTTGAATDAAKADANEAGRADRDFVGDMMTGGRAEIDLGKLAQQKARNAKVKEFAAMMVRDHTKAAEDLKNVAVQANVDMTKVDADAGDNKDVHDRLAKLSGAGRWTHLYHAGREQQLFLAPLHTPAGEPILVVIFDSDSSLGLVTLFYQQLEQQIGTLPELHAARGTTDQASFERDLNAGLKLVAPESRR